MKTFQGFIIWGHGMKYIEEILSIIRNTKNIEIKKIFKKINVDIRQFVKHIYALDESSKKHLSEKTKYLQSVQNQLFLVIVTDNNTVYAKKPNNHKYPYSETFIKWKVRLLYNPRTKYVDTDNQITKENIEKAIVQKFWIPEITQNHVIHCTDNEEELAHILKLFCIDLEKSKDYITNRMLTNYTRIKISIDNIVANTCEQDEVPILETPHYKYLCGQKEQYRNYILKYLGTIIKDDHLPEKYDMLINNFDYGKLINNIPSFVLLKKAKKPAKYVIIDGVHRVAILKKRNIEIINAYLEE